MISSIGWPLLYVLTMVNGFTAGRWLDFFVRG